MVLTGRPASAASCPMVYVGVAALSAAAGEADFWRAGGCPCISSYWRSYHRVMMTTNRNTAQAHGNEHRARKEVSPAPALLEVPAGEIDRSIYVMPSFATFEVTSLDTSRRWYVEGLGFVVLATLPGQDGAPALVHLRRWRYQDLLLVPARHEAAGSRGAGVRVT